MAVTAGSATLKFLEDKWDDVVASKLDAPELLRYRSNLLGSGKRRGSRLAAAYIR